MSLYEGRCRICEKKYGKGFLFHHLWYWADELIYSNFKSTDLYHKYLILIIYEEPYRFVLLCGPCHNKIDNYRRGVGRLTRDHQINFIMVLMMSSKERRRR